MYGIYLSAAGAQSFSNVVDVVSNNIANAQTVGFRREFPVLRARHAEAIELGQVPAGLGGPDEVGGGVFMSETRSDFSPGTFEETGQPTDLALADRDGRTFFQVEQGGERLLTRAGNFYVDGEGVLRTQEDAAVLSASGSALRVDPRFPIHVTPDGQVTQAETGIRVPLSLMRAADVSDLVKVGQNTFRDTGRATPAGVEHRMVRQGYLEQASSQPVQEMVELIKASRAYEANVRMIQHHDTTVGTLISRLLGGGNG